MKPIILSVCFIFMFASSSFSLMVNDPAPFFSLRDGNNKYFHLSNYVGAKKTGFKGIIINLFAYYCKPC
ncbi:MAG: hypothetical protein Q7T83_12325, partial [Thermodesulfovibrionales bacterium]|nr:hypothetical protein [Thermodesulfovibrionales bacterium]